MKKLLLFILLVCVVQVKAQCVSTFPYVEDFETSAAWTTSISPTASVAVNDWTWGTPNHTYVIKSAGSGNNCWCTGGLTGAFYNYREQVYVVSPCFNFSNLPNPNIQFKLFYETQARYDGGNLQSSIDGGTTWQDVGSVGGTTYAPIIEPNNCYTQNWYNNANLLYLNSPAGFVISKHGWSGNVQAGGVGWDASQPGTNCIGGQGMGQWITARHNLNGLGGQANVLLRFTFGSGYVCNNFDGFAFDSVSISNLAPNPVTVSYNLVQDAAPNTWDTYPTYSTNVTNARWYWGDGTSTMGLYTSHTYTTAGKYNICVSAYSSCGDSSVYCQNDSVYRLANSNQSNLVYINVLNNQTTGIEKTSNNLQIEVNPNPNNGIFTIETNLTEKHMVFIFDVNGKLVFSQFINGETVIDARSLNAGVYSLNVVSNKGSVTKKLAIVK